MKSTSDIIVVCMKGIAPFPPVKGLSQMRKKHLRQILFCISEKEFKEVKKKAPKKRQKRVRQKEDR